MEGLMFLSIVDLFLFCCLDLLTKNSHPMSFFLGCFLN